MKGKVKRLLSLLLTAALLCGLVPAAFAADTVPPLYEQFGCVSVDEFMDDWTLSKAPNYDWVCERYAVHYDALKSNPDMAFAQAYSNWTWAMVDTYFTSRDEFLRDAAMQLVRYDVWNYLPPLSVQLNGQTLAFADAQPEMAGTRVMVPLRGMIDALGGETAFDLADKTVTATANGVTVYMTIGQTAYSWSLTPEEQQELQEGLAENQNAGGANAGMMDAAPYIKNGRTYVPVRFFAEALGLTVRWDEGAHAAVVYDPAALAAEIDGQFAIVNKWLAAQPKRNAEETLRTAVSLAMSYTKFHTIDGDTVYPVTGTMTAVTKGQSCEFDIKVDLRTLLDLLMEDLGDRLDEDDLATYDAMKEAMQDAMQDAGFEVIYNADEQVLYFRSPSLIKWLRAVDEPYITQYVKNIDPSVWLKVGVPAEENPFGGLTGLPKAEALLDGATVGTLLANMAAETGRWRSALLWQDTVDRAQKLAAYLGDDCFTVRGDTCSAGFRFASDDEDAPSFTPYDGYIEMSLTLNTATGSIKGAIETRENGYRDTLTTCTIEGNAATAHATVSVHTANVGIFELTADVSQKAGVPAPRTAPPEGSTVIDLDALTAAPAA